VEDRISGLDDTIGIKGSTEDFLDKRLKSCKRNRKENSNYIQTPNLQIMGIEKGKEV
jgi:hypothetical protein